MKNKILIVLFVVLFVFVISSIYNILGKDKRDTIEVISSSDSELDIKKENNIDSNINSNSNSNILIKVDIKGAVKKPGVYEVSSELRVIDVINKAGGLASGANTNYINLSSKVKDEMVIWIYTDKELENIQLDKDSTQYMIQECNCPVVDNTTCLNNDSNEEKNNTVNDAIVNINKASLEELTTLDGIGDSKAKNIIDYRNKNGNFLNKEDIMNVSGIGESAYNKIKNNITV